METRSGRFPGEVADAVFVDAMVLFSPSQEGRMMLHLTDRWYARSRAAVLGLALAACADTKTPSGIAAGGAKALSSAVQAAGEPNAAAGDVKAFIGGWLDGKSVQLLYTRSYYCNQPPTSVAPSECEIGALPEDFPRSGPIPVIYALAPIGFTPTDPATLHCPGTPLCPNHPPMIDVTRLGLPGVSVVSRAPHSHIITSRQGGWHRTVNIRVLSLTAWDQIVAAPSLETVRQLQAAHPEMISGDNPTNIFFFFVVHTHAQGP